MSDVGELCRACALCCDGTLFAYVTVSAADAEKLRDRDLALSARKDGSFRLPQACRALAGRDCAIYEARPSSCRSYACLLATQLEEGELKFSEAREVVEGAHARLNALRASMGAEGSPVPLVRESLRGDRAALSEEAARAWTDAREYLRRHFTGRHGMS